MIWLLLRSLVSTFKTRRSLALENLALQQQLAVLQRSVKRPRLSNLDRGLWVLLRRFWTDWAKALVLVKPDTVVRWHRAGFSTLLDVEESATAAGSPMRCPGDSRADPRHVPGQPTWGSAARARRASEARHLHFPGRCFQVHDSRSQATVPDLAELSRQSCRGLGVHRLLHVADRHLPDSVRFHHSPSRSPAHRPFQCHGASFGRVDRAADRRCLPVGYGAALHAARPGWNLRGVLQTARCGTRHRAGSNGAVLRATRGRAPTSNGSLEAFGASVSIT